VVGGGGKGLLWWPWWDGEGRREGGLWILRTNVALSLLTPRAPLSRESSSTTTFN
jgi:hypothetical protein